MRPQLEYSYEDYGNCIYKWIHTNKATSAIEDK